MTDEFDRAIEQVIFDVRLSEDLDPDSKHPMLVATGVSREDCYKFMEEFVGCLKDAEDETIYEFFTAISFAIAIGVHIERNRHEQFERERAT